ncbi:DUF1549 and DUF1553 domain-containing protein, partial [Singulisphaera rosea]
MRIANLLGLVPVLLVISSSLTSAAEGAPKTLEIYPPKVRLFGPGSTQRLVVIGVGGDGTRLDSTVKARFSSNAAAVVSTDPGGILRAIG